MNLFRPDIARIAGYTPGEQPQEAGWVKLNTNENPYPPSPRVVEAIEAAARGRLNIYPDPHGTKFRQAAGKFFDLDPDCILPANGSDENLTILLRTFVDPGQSVCYPYPSYVLYETLAHIQGAIVHRLPLRDDCSADLPAWRERLAECRMVLVPNPNSPTGNRFPDDVLRAMIPPQGVLVLDEAYGDFCDVPHRAELLKKLLAEGKERNDPSPPRLIITRSFSKSYSMAGVRFGFAMAAPELIREMRKAKDSYNCDAISLAAATAALQDSEWMLANTAKVRTTRARLTTALRQLGFHVVDSQANFVWARHPEQSHQGIYEALKQRKILVRYMKFPNAGSGGREEIDGLRISVGTDQEIDALLAAMTALG